MDISVRLQDLHGQTGPIRYIRGGFTQILNPFIQILNPNATSQTIWQGGYFLLEQHATRRYTPNVNPSIYCSGTCDVNNSLNFEKLVGRLEAESRYL